MIIRPYHPSDRAEWLRLRQLLWPQPDPQAHESDMSAWLARPDAAVLVAARSTEGKLAGFAEVASRSIADGCETSPVGYLEGWYVDEDVRRQGVGAALVRAAQDWARRQGYRELASDAELHNIGSQRAHAALGFTEVGRAVLYLKRL